SADPEGEFARDRVDGVQPVQLLDVESVLDTPDDLLPRLRAGLKHQVRDSHLGDALVGPDRAAGGTGSAAARGVGVLQVAEEGAVPDQVDPAGGYALAVEGPAGQSLRQPRVV